ncbi:CHAD domain-containing protein [Paeniglutamicibacter sp. ABSL32-1]|uniref:CHAD domain-containing protein n=1 Tax=Paeniglutamicibacter quisquiliarum TaxID=2849498 RepID=UPI001C2D90FE|nr:CHAD domain-containing protein [Paeniglutamicibacter quisquiliarum]MBV1777626.1 CHAD domain-containing protein [Paeniglutamicibacter quisquiliarum]
MAKIRGHGNLLRRPGTSRSSAAGKTATVLSVAIAYMDGQIAELGTQEPGVRSGSPGAVHDMRAATRRLRSALDIYGHLFETSRRRSLGHELKWLAKALGRSRDAEVVRERLDDRLAELPAKWRTEVLAESLERAFGDARDAGHRRVGKALKSRRYRRLLEDLGRFRDDPPTREPARRPAGTEVAASVNDQARIVDRSHRAMLRAKPGHDRDVALHRLRKDTKRLLHAAESAAGIHPKRAAALARRSRRLQKILGNHQDSVMTRAFLESLAADPALPEETRRACEKIIKREEDIARSAARQYARARRTSGALRLRR